MHSIVARDANDALLQGVQYLLDFGLQEPSRNGPVLVAPNPVCTTYLNPARMVVLSPTRDANPFFHLFESMWMLAGRNDVATPSAFAANIANYSDNKTTLHGAYGYRWRQYFGYDQLRAVVKELQRDPNTRRAVLAMWDGGQTGPTGPSGGDLAYAANGLDIPCNTHCYFDLRGGKLNITVCCRSNDIIWGAYGANIVQFGMLLCYMAAWLGVPVGVYRQISNNYHLYTEKFSTAKLEAIVAESSRRCMTPRVIQGPFSDGGLMDADDAEADLVVFLNRVREWMGGIVSYPDRKFCTPFFAHTLEPMFAAYQLHKLKNTAGAMDLVAGCVLSKDWRMAAYEWLRRRLR